MAYYAEPLPVVLRVEAAPTPTPTPPPRPFYYIDGPVNLVVGGTEYKIGQSYLFRRSDIFAERLAAATTATPGITPVLHLNDDPSVFEHFLWAVHAAPDESEEFAKLSFSETKVTKLLDIGSTCLDYACWSLGEWAMRTVLDSLEGRTSISFEATLIRKLVLTCTRWSARKAEYRRRMHGILQTAMQNDRADLMAVVLVADEVSPDDTFLLAYAYYYLLKKGFGNRDWERDSRVRDIDRRRLLCGFFALTTKWHALCTSPQMATATWSLAPSALIDKAEAAQNVGGYYSAYSHDFLKTSEIRDRLWSFFDLAPWHL